MAGKLITFEGIEGVGKTTNLNFIADILKSQGHELIITREPGGTPMGEEIRDILLLHRKEVVCPKTELLLMFATRAQHYARVIKPGIESGKIILCDRFTDASFAYQGGGRGVDVKDIEALENIVLGDFRPDLTFVFDIEPKLGLERAKARGGIDRIEQEKIEFFARVRKAYLDRAKLNPKRYKVIDASRELKDVQSDVLATFNKWMNDFE